jgi:hypothetical protein
LEPQGLPAGTYSVSVTLKSDGSTVQLGSFAVGAAGTNGDDDGVDDGQGDQSGDDQETDDGQGEVEFGNDTSIPFPANFNAFDIATISVSDANNVVLFTADLTNTVTASSMNISANVQAKGGPGNPSATGSAVLTAVNTHGKVKGSLQLSGRGLLPSTPLTVAINGIAAKKVNSDKSGNVKVLFKANGKTATLASGVTLFKVTSVSLRDKLGNVVLTASF